MRMPDRPDPIAHDALLQAALRNARRMRRVTPVLIILQLAIGTWSVWTLTRPPVTTGERVAAGAVIVVNLLATGWQALQVPHWAGREAYWRSRIAQRDQAP
jgi:heme A synthase